MGSEKIFRVEPKKQLKMFRRSVVAEKNIKIGEKFSVANISLKRPGSGLEPKFLKKIIGKKSKNFIKLLNIYFFVL